MKTPIKFLTLILSLSIFMFLLSFSSCEKETMHEYDPGKVKSTPPGPSKDSFLQQLDLEADLNDNNSKQGPESSATLSEALESIDFDARPEWRVAIKAYTCVRSGKTLLVYNPSHPNLDFYNSDKFLVIWFKDGKPVKGTNRLECVCKGKYAAIVINRVTKQGIGIAFYTGRACYIEVAKTNANTDF